MKKNIVIVGAGPAGLCLARSLEETDLHVTVIEKGAIESFSNPAPDGRDIALTHFSKKSLEKFGAWKHIPTESISTIEEAKVLDGHSPYALHFNCNEINHDTLGYLVPNYQIRKALFEVTANNPKLEFMFNTAVTSVTTDESESLITLSNGETLSAALIVAADSRFSETRRNMGIAAHMHDFGQAAIVCTMEHEIPHQQVAYECFQYGRTLAVLPLHGNKSSIVITAPENMAKTLIDMSPHEFSFDVEQYFNRKFGNMELLGDRHLYPLVAVYARKFVAKRFALIGDAAVGMHPVTAHGFNLGIMGQQTLTTLIKSALKNNEDIASNKLLSSYQSKHRRDSLPIYLGTNAIVKLYNNDHRIPKLLRKAVLRVGNRILPAKRAIMRHLTTESRDFPLRNLLVDRRK
jgi:ubiquinone biosynthesis UbiH/UbiF/VisC/COQ6 family hydroxylase